MKRVSVFLILILACCNFNLVAQEALVSISGAVIVVEKGGSLFVNGGISLEKNSKLLNEGTITIAQAGKEKADFMDQNSTGYHYGAGKFVFTGSAIPVHIILSITSSVISSP